MVFVLNTTTKNLGYLPSQPPPGPVKTATTAIAYQNEDVEMLGALLKAAASQKAPPRGLRDSEHAPKLDNLVKEKPVTPEKITPPAA